MMLARQIMKPAVIAMMRTCSFVQKRMFAIEQTKITKSIIPKLMSTLHVEHENEKGADDDERIKERRALLKKNGFDIFETEDSSKISLIKKADKYDVEISFYSADTENTDFLDEEDQQLEHDNSDNEAMIPLQIRIKNKEGEGWMIEASKDEEGLQVYMVSSLKVYDKIQQSNPLNKVAEYLGPSFFNLGNNMQKQFIELLTELGINNEVLSCIKELYNDKEQRMYVKWLSEMHRVLGTFQ